MQMLFAAKLALFFVLIKFLVFPAYHSTDFEVHRNWLRITNTLPIKEWYFDERAIGTLDYPPLFAYWEYILSQAAEFFIPESVTEIVYNEKAATFSKFKTFHRISVIVTEILFLYAIVRYLSRGENKNYGVSTVFAAICYGQFGYLIIDNIHFQYNSAMQGIFLLSVYMIEKEEYIKGAILFSVVLNFKHIFIYSACAFFVFLLKKYCVDHGSSFRMRQLLMNLLKLGSCVLGIFFLCFLPFLSKDQLVQILARLFPVKRGLVHDYWAGNFWAVYSFLGELGNIICKLKTNDKQFCDNKTILPDVSPFATIIIIILVSLPLWVRIWKKPRSDRFIVYCALQNLIFFLFAFQVHEKAILMSLNLLQLTSIKSEALSKEIFKMSYVAGITFIPLIFLVHESTVIFTLFYLYHAIYLVFLQYQWKKRTEIFFNKWELLQLAVGFLLMVWFLWISSFFKEMKMTNMLISLYGAVSNIMTFVYLYKECLQDKEEESNETKYKQARYLIEMN